MFFKSFDKTEIFYTMGPFEMTGDIPKFVVIHGLFEHSRRYYELIREISSWRLPVFALDLRGHGESHGIANEFLDFIWDLNIFLHHLQAQHKCCKFYLFGHNMGGLIIIRFLQEFPEFIDKIKGIVLSSPLFGWNFDTIRKIEFKIAKFFSYFVPKITIKNIINPFDLSSDTKIAIEYAADQKIKNEINLFLLRSIDDNISKMWLQGFVGFSRTLIIYAANDKLTNVESTEKFIKEFREYDVPLTSKKFFNSSHEVFNDVEKDEAFDLLANWLKARPG